MPDNFLDIGELNRPAGVGFSKASDEQLKEIQTIPGMPEDNPTQNKVKELSAAPAEPEVKQAQSMTQDDFYDIVDNAVQSGDFEGQTTQQIYEGMLESVTQDGIIIDGISPTPKPEEVKEEIVEEEPQEDVEGFDIGVKTGEVLGDVGKALKVESKFDIIPEDNSTLVGSMKNRLKELANSGRFLVNLPGDAIELAGDVTGLVSNIGGTVRGVKDLGVGFADRLGLVEGTEEQKAIVDATVQSLKDNFGSGEKALETITQNPVDALTSVFGGAGLAKSGIKATAFGKTAKGAELVKKLDTLQEISNPINALKTELAIGKKVIGKPLGFVAKELPAQLLGKTTGAGAEAIKTAFKKGGNESFGKALRGELTDEDILTSAKKGFETIKEQRAEVYGADYQKLIQNKKKLGTFDIEDSLIKNIEDSKVKIVPSDDGFKLDFKDSTITQKASQNQIKEMFDDVIYWSDDTPEGLDVLKQRIQDRWIGGEGTQKADRLSTILSNKVKDKVVKEVPEYAEMTAKYEKVTNELKEIDRVLRLGNEKNKMTAITRLGQSMKDNLSFRKEMVDKLEELSGIELKSAISGASLRDVLPKGLVGAVAPTGIGFGLGSGILSPGLIPLILGSSPRIIGELARGIGVTTNVLNKGLSNAQSLFKRKTPQ